VRLHPRQTLDLVQEQLDRDRVGEAALELVPACGQDQSRVAGKGEKVDLAGARAVAVDPATVELTRGGVVDEDS
jgi:hypothetical protein